MKPGEPRTVRQPREGLLRGRGVEDELPLGTRRALLPGGHVHDSLSTGSFDAENGPKSNIFKYVLGSLA